jgi:hypothetical protein
MALVLRISIVVTIAVHSTVSAGAPANRSRTSADGRQLLQRLGFSTDETTAVERGAAIATVIETDNRQIAVRGAVRIAAPVERLVQRFRTIDYLKQSSLVLESGVFGNPATTDDLRQLSLEPYDLDLRECRAGNCRVRLSSDVIERFHREVDWRGKSWRLESAALWRTILTEMVTTFRAAGTGALPVYANKTQPLSVREELNLLASDMSAVTALVPELDAYLRDPLRAPLPSAEQLDYWSKEDFGVRPVMRITHQTMFMPPERADAPGVVIVTTQLYADHYLDASLGVTLTFDAPGASGFYMVAINRARTRSLTGLLRGVVRSAVLRRSRDAMFKVLQATQSSLR